MSDGTLIIITYFIHRTKKLNRNKKSYGQISQNLLQKQNNKKFENPIYDLTFYEKKIILTSLPNGVN